MTFDFSELFNKMGAIKHFEKDMKNIEQEIVEAATSEMQKAIERVYFINAPRLKGKAQKFVIPLKTLQNAVITKNENGVIESYIDQTQLDRGSGANANIFIDINSQLIAKRSLYREPGLRMTKEEKLRTGRQHPEEYYVRDMDEYWQLPLGSISELEYIEKAWVFRLNSIRLHYLGVIEEYKNRLDRLAKFKEQALAIEGPVNVKKIYNDALKQKELQDNLDYFVKFQNGEFKFDEKEG